MHFSIISGHTVYDTRARFNNDLCFDDITTDRTMEKAGQAHAVLAVGAACGCWRFGFVSLSLSLSCPNLPFFYPLFLRRLDIDRDTI